MRFAAVFPGQGSQHQGMGKDLFENFSVARLAFEEASDSLKLDLKRLCFDTHESDLKLTANTQVALLITSVAAYRVFQTESPHRPMVALGHSLGELSALTCVGAMTLSDAIILVRSRGLAMQEAVPPGVGGMMALIGLDDTKVEQACRDYQSKAREEGKLPNTIIEAANYNCPGQVVISGHQKALEFMKDHFDAAAYGATRAKFIPLAVSSPFHCSLMKPAAEKFKTQLERTPFASSFDTEIIHNVTAEGNNDGSILPELLYKQITQPVLWTKSVSRAFEECQSFIEFGAGRVLSGLIKKIAPGAETLNVDTAENLKSTLMSIKGV